VGQGWSSIDAALGALDPLDLILTIWLTTSGLAIGSFLNVVIIRLPAGASVVKPRSKCPRCGHMLAWYDNLPVLSWVLLRARCRSCALPISARYPLVELLTGALWLSCLARFGWDYELAPALVLVTLLIPLALIDAEHWILPFELTLPGIALGVLLSIPLGGERITTSVLGALLGCLSLRAMEFFGWLLFRKEALGGGDKFLFALLGAFLGHGSLLGVMLLASLQGAVFGIARLLITGRAGPQAQPVAPSPESGVLEPQPVEAEPKMSWAFLAPGLSLPRRLLAIPYGIFLQPIPDDPVDETGEEVEWQPGATNLPFGPWMVLGGLELLLLGPLLGELLPAFRWLFLGPGPR
jgi:leader peptidase (prepilin peptidase)/N-methyltransferase